jgi:hypothetical protein
MMTKVFAIHADDSTLSVIITKGRLALKTLQEQNQQNTAAGMSEKNNYILNINTADIDPVRVDSLDKEFIKQRHLVYDLSSPAMADGFFIPNEETLGKLNEELRTLNNKADNTIKTYLLMVNLVPMNFVDGFPIGITLNDLLSDENPDVRNQTIAKQAMKEAAEIVEGITQPFIGQQQGQVLFCGFLKFRTFLNSKKLNDIFIYYPHNNVENVANGAYGTILKNYLSRIRFKNGPQYVEDFIVAIAGNNLDYKNLPVVKSQILQVTVAREMDELLGKITENAYELLSIEERIHALKVLSGFDIPGARETLIVRLIKTTPADQIADLLEGMQSLNDKAPERYVLDPVPMPVTNGDGVPNPKRKMCLLSCIINDTEDGFMGIGKDNYKLLMQTFIRLVKALPNFDEVKTAYYRSPDVISRKIIWDRSYAFSLYAKEPIGTNKYDVEVNTTDGTIALEKQQLTKYEDYTPAVEIGGIKIPIPPPSDAVSPIVLHPVWEKEPSINLKPFDLVSFTDKSDLSLLEAASAKNEQEPVEKFVPAIFLQYAKDKKLNQDIGKGVEMGFDIITLITPIGEVAYLGKTARYIYKGIEITAKVGAAANLAVNTELVPYGSKAAFVIKKFYAISSFLQLTNIGLAIKNGKIAKLKQTEAEDFLRGCYEAEGELNVLAAKEPELVGGIRKLQNEIEQSGEAAGYGKDWATAIRNAVQKGINNTVEKFRKFNFFKQKPLEKSAIGFLDGKGQTVAHTLADGSLVIDKTATIMTEKGAILEIVEGAHFRTAENVAETTGDLVLVRNADGTIQCLNGACFVAGTAVHTENGLKPIEQIRENDVVLGVDVASGSTRWQKVKHSFSKSASKLISIVAGKDTILSTPEHPYLTIDGWKSAVDIKKGQQLRLAGAALVTVLAVMPIDTIATVYNLETESTHNYCVGKQGVVVHNDCNVLLKLKNDEELYKHIFEGDYRKVTGCHYYDAVDNVNVRFVAGVTEETNAFGVIKADIEMRKPVLNSRLEITGYNWKLKNTKGEPQTFFPRTWSKDKILEECASALTNANKEVVPGYSRMFHAESTSGVFIRWFEDANGNVLSVFPEF